MFLKLHIGCGMRHIPGYVHIDVMDCATLITAVSPISFMISRLNRYP